MDLKNSLLLIGGFAVWSSALLLPAEYAAGEGFLMGFGLTLMVTAIYKAITQYIKQRKGSTSGKIAH